LHLYGSHWIKLASETIMTMKVIKKTSNNGIINEPSIFHLPFGYQQFQSACPLAAFSCKLVALPVNVKIQ
jgi:hypothetical protein